MDKRSPFWRQHSISSFFLSSSVAVWKHELQYYQVTSITSILLKLVLLGCEVMHASRIFQASFGSRSIRKLQPSQSRFLCRIFSAPSKKEYIKDAFNWADVASAMGLLLRVSCPLIRLLSTSNLRQILYISAWNIHHLIYNYVLCMVFPCRNHGLFIFMWVWDGMGNFLHSNQRTHLTIVSIQPSGVLIICIYNNL